LIAGTLCHLGNWPRGEIDDFTAIGVQFAAFRRFIRVVSAKHP